MEDFNDDYICDYFKLQTKECDLTKWNDLINRIKNLNGEIIEKYDRLIKPPHPISERITNVTNITNDMVKDCPNEEETINIALSNNKDDD